MVKKLLSVAAATAVMVSGGMAFDIYDDGNPGKNGIPYIFSTPAAAPTGLAPNVTANTPLTRAPIATQAFGDALIFPLYFAGGGWQTELRVINTSPSNAVVAKVVFYAASDSKELRDFNIYLSAGDVWRGTVKLDDDGNIRLISSDDSSPLQNGGMADAQHPLKTDPIASPVGYVAVIGCAMTVDRTRDVFGSAAAVPAAYTPTDFRNATAHSDHLGLRNAYNAMIADARGIVTPIFQNGIITSGVKAPNINLTMAHTTPSNVAGDNRADYFFGPVANVLTGDERITDVANGKDMIMPAVALTNVTDDITAGVHQGLLYAEGEAAHIADRTLTGVNGVMGATRNNPAGSVEYFYPTLGADIAAFNRSNVWMTYGDTDEYANNQLVLTSPYKRVAVIADSDLRPTTPNSNGNITPAARVPAGFVGGVYQGVQFDNARQNVVNFGYFSSLALVFDESENQARFTQFSPANTPTLNFYTEVAATEGNQDEKANLSYYIQAAQQNGGFEKGYTLMRFLNGPIPTIVTQMIATKAGSQTVTNWFVPTQN